MEKIYFTFILGISSFLNAKAQAIVPDSIASNVSFIEKQNLSGYNGL